MKSTLNNKVIIFFFRAYNDIDHMTPILYKLHKRHSDIDLEVLIIDLNDDYKEDFRISFLLKNNIKIKHIVDYLNFPKKIKTVYLKLIKLCDRLGRLNVIRILISRLIIKSLQKYLKKKLKRLSCEKLLSDLRKDRKAVLVFDQSYVKLYDRLCELALQNNIPTVAVPHGHNTFDNELIWVNSMDIEFNSSQVQKPFNFQYVVFENKIIEQRYKRLGLLINSKTVILGSARFCTEWVYKLREILPTVTLPELSEDTLKIVFMMSKSKYNGHPSEVERTIKYISQFPNTYLIIKPHTRGMRFQKEFNNNVKIVSNDFHSPILIDWADVVLFTMTSVIFDCLKMDKPVIYLKNTHANRLLSERYFTSWQVECRDDIRKLIWRLKNNKASRTYSKKDRDRYCSEVIEPEGKDVLNNYRSFLVDKF